MRGSMREHPSDATSQRSTDGCDCPRSTRRDVLAFVSALGLEAVAGTLAAKAEPADERPKEGDLLVALEGESTTPLVPKDIPAGGPPLLAWPMEPAGPVVRN